MARVWVGNTRIVPIRSMASNTKREKGWNLNDSGLGFNRQKEAKGGRSARLALAHKCASRWLFNGRVSNSKFWKLTLARARKERPQAAGVSQGYRNPGHFEAPFLSQNVPILRPGLRSKQVAGHQAAPKGSDRSLADRWGARMPCGNIGGRERHDHPHRAPSLRPIDWQSHPAAGVVSDRNGESFPIEGPISSPQRPLFAPRWLGFYVIGALPASSKKVDGD